MLLIHIRNYIIIYIQMKYKKQSGEIFFLNYLIEKILTQSYRLASSICKL